MDFVKMLAAYVDTGQISNTSIRDAEDIIGKYRLRILCIKLLGWMKSQHRIGKPSRLHLKKEHAWCKDLRELMLSTAMFDNVLEIQNHFLDFATSLTQESRSELCATADQLYDAPLWRERTKAGRAQ